MSGRLAVAIILLGVAVIALVAVILAAVTDDPRLPPAEPTPTVAPRVAFHGAPDPTRATS